MSGSEFYLIARSASPQGGIYRCRLDGEIPQILGFTAAPGINYLVFSADRKFAFASGGNAERQGFVQSFQITSSGDLRPAEPVYSGGRNACALGTEPSGKFLWCADYDSGDLVEFPLNAGTVGAPVKMIRHAGSGPVKGRQDSPHVHQVQLTPDGRYVVANDLGSDTLTCYPLDPERGITETGTKVHHTAPGDGPRHLLFATDRPLATALPKGPMEKFLVNREKEPTRLLSGPSLAYLVNELGNTVTALAYQDGTFRELAKVSTLPEGCDAVTKASAIRFSPDYRWLFVSNRGFDSTAVFALHADGMPELHAVIPVNGSSPRDIGMLPGGRDFAAANENSDLVTFFHWDGATGTLTATGKILVLPHPLFIAW